jgi:hypothetical protein
LVLRKSSNEGRGVGFMVFTIKPSFMPSPKRSFH